MKVLYYMIHTTLACVVIFQNRLEFLTYDGVTGFSVDEQLQEEFWADNGVTVLPLDEHLQDDFLSSGQTIEWPAFQLSF